MAGTAVRSENTAALLSPAPIRKFPFSAPLRTRPAAHFVFAGLANVEFVMTIKAGGRSALIVATGLFVCFAAPLPAAAATDDNAVAEAKSAGTEADDAQRATVRKYTRHGSRYWKRHAHRKSSKVALKSPARKKADPTDAAADGSDISNTIPASVANANAQVATQATTQAATQVAAAGTPDSPLAGNARAMSARANDILQATPDHHPADGQAATQPEMVASDQLNEVDRTAPPSAPPAPTLAVAMADTPAATETASSDDGSSWDQASLIGKIFIGFGALLTMASAARMLMA
jgi:hypothetical protein